MSTVKLKDIKVKFTQAKLMKASLDHFTYPDKEGNKKLILYHPFWVEDEKGNFHEDFIRPSFHQEFWDRMKKQLNEGRIYVTIVNNERLAEQRKKACQT